MNSTKINYFLTVAKCLNFSEAARQLYVAQSSLSQQINSFEAELGFTLFIRTKRSVTLTPAGQILFNELQKYDQWMTQIIEKARQVEIGKRGNLTIGILSGLILRDDILEKINSFIKEYPDININTLYLPIHETHKEIDNLNVDIAISLSFFIDEFYNKEYIVLSTEEDCIAFSRNSMLGEKAKVTIEDLNRCTFIAIAPQSSLPAMNNNFNYLKQIGVTTSNVKFVSSIEEIILNIELGLGYAVVGRSTRIFGTDSVTMINFPVRGSVKKETHTIGIWNINNPNPALHEFLDHLKQNR